MTTATSTDPSALAAIGEQRLAQWAAEVPGPFAAAAATTCATIGAEAAGVAGEVASWLSARGLEVAVDATPRPRQRHDVRIRASDVDSASRAADLLSELGFERWDRWSRGAARSFRRHADQITVARTTDHSEVLRITWRDSSARGRATALLRPLFRPTHGDWNMVDLPTRLSPLYSVVRPIRLVLERTGQRDRHAAGLGPFLATPTSLIAPLLDLIDLGRDDTLLDLGCGDGRLAIAATRDRGCPAIGVELDADLAERARRDVVAHRLSDLVDIVEGDARSTDLSDVTVAFMFLPMDVVMDIIGDVLDRLPTGARLVVHEQTALPPRLSPRPDSSTAIVAGDAVTVAHVWTA